MNALVPESARRHENSESYFCAREARPNFRFFWEKNFLNCNLCQNFQLGDLIKIQDFFPTLNKIQDFFPTFGLKIKFKTIFPKFPTFSRS